MGRLISPQAFRGLTAWDATAVLKQSGAWTLRKQPVPGWVFAKGPARVNPGSWSGHPVVIATCHDQPMSQGEQARLSPRCRVWAGVNVEAPPWTNVIPIPCGLAPDGSTDDGPSRIEAAIEGGPWPLVRQERIVACWDDRKDAARIALKARIRGFGTVLDKVPAPVFAQALKRHRWVASPAGLGWDCYRTWEALICGAYVIVERTPLDESVFDGLPVVIVEDWDDVTPAFLEVTARELAHRTWDYDRLLLPFWANRIRERVQRG